MKKTKRVISKKSVREIDMSMPDPVDNLNIDVNSKFTNYTEETGVYSGTLYNKANNVSIDYEIECTVLKSNASNVKCSISAKVSPIAREPIGQFVFFRVCPVSIDIGNGLKLKFESLDPDGGLRNPKKICYDFQYQNNWNRRSKTITFIPEVNKIDNSVPFISNISVSKDTWKKIKAALNVDKSNTLKKANVGELMFPEKNLGTQINNDESKAAYKKLDQPISIGDGNKVVATIKRAPSAFDSQRGIKIDKTGKLPVVSEDGKEIVKGGLTNPVNVETQLSVIEPIYFECLLTRVLALEKTMNEFFKEFKEQAIAYRNQLSRTNEKV